MTDYDCSPRPLPEAVVHRTVRAVHNLFHPHHKHLYAAPIALMCHEPQMETVTVTANVDAPGMPTGIDAPDIGFGYSGTAMSSYGNISSGVGVAGRTSVSHPVAVPEPAGYLMLLPALLAVWLIRRAV